MESLKRKAVTLLQLTVTSALVLSLTCPDNEYMLPEPDRCCSKCPPGTRVTGDCSPRNSTTECEPCDVGTFMNEPTFRTECHPCTSRTCEGPGLMVKTCSRSSDSLCEVQEGYFCEKSDGDSCVSAKKHCVCEPGQYIKQQGSASSDTVCHRCTKGNYSDGTSTSCQPHTLCERLNKVTVKPGTSSSDALCAQLHTRDLILSVVLFVVVLIFAILKCIKYCVNDVLVTHQKNVYVLI